MKFMGKCFRSLLLLGCLVASASAWADVDDFSGSEDGFSPPSYKSVEANIFKSIGGLIGFSEAKGSNSVVIGPAGTLGYRLENQGWFLFVDASVYLLAGLSDSMKPYFAPGFGVGGKSETLDRSVFVGFDYRMASGDSPGNALTIRLGIIPLYGSFDQRLGFEFQYETYERTTTTKKFTYPTGLFAVRYFL